MCTRIWRLRTSTIFPLLLWTELCLPNSYIKAPTSNVMVFGNGVFERQFSLDEVLKMGSSWWHYSPHKKRLQRVFFFPHHVRTQQEGDHLEESSVRLARALWSRTLRNKFLSFKLVSLWHFISEAPADQGIYCITFLCYVTNGHKFSSVKTIWIFISQFQLIEHLCGLIESSAQGPT